MKSFFKKVTALLLLLGMILPTAVPAEAFEAAAVDTFGDVQEAEAVEFEEEPVLLEGERYFPEPCYDLLLVDDDLTEDAWEEDAFTEAVPEDDAAGTEAAGARSGAVLAQKKYARAALADRFAALTQPEGKQSPIADIGTVSVIASGTCGAYGSNLTWDYVSLNNTSTLIISGSGEMADYSSTYDTPWKNSAGWLTGGNLIVCEGVTSIGSYAFDWYDMYTVQLPQSLTRIGAHAFDRCQQVSELTVYPGLTQVGEYALGTGTTIHFASSNLDWEKVEGYKTALNSSFSDGRVSGIVFETNFINSSTAKISRSSYVYTGTARKPAVKSVTFYGKTLTEGTDYTVSYDRNVKVGTGRVIITGKGDYTGKRYRTFKITARSIAKAKVTGIKSKVYTGAKRTQAPVVKLAIGSKTVKLKKGTDYTLSYRNNIKKGTATVVIKGKGNYKGSVTKTFKITARSLAKATVTGIKTKGYTGKAVTQSPVVKLKIGSTTKTLKKGTDYTLTYKNNKNIGTAKVTITGKGNYKGSITKSFKIVKGTPTLKFAKTKVTITGIGKTYTNKLTTNSGGKKTFTSSNKSVVTVNATTGKLTAKKAGKATITVKLAATSKFKARTGKFTVTVKNYKVTWSKLRLSFSNSRYDFDYSYYYTIPKARYQLMFGSRADSAYSLYGGGTWGGNCYGMSTATSMMNVSGSGVTVKQFDSGATKPHDLTISSYSSKYGLTFRDFIEAMQITQYTSTATAALNTHYNDYAGLISAVKKVKTTGKPVVICAFGTGGGHALVGYSVTKVDTYTSKLNIYDPNFPNETRYITIYTNSSGTPTGWYYCMNDMYDWGSAYSGSNITYVTYSTFLKTWNNRGSNDLRSMIGTNSGAFDVLDASGNVIASMENGVFTSSEDGVRQFIPVDVQTDRTYVTLPDHAVQVVNRDDSMETFELSTLEGTISVKAANAEAAAVIHADATFGEVKIDAAAGQAYEVVVQAADGTVNASYSGLVGEEELTLDPVNGPVLPEETVTETEEAVTEETTEAVVPETEEAVTEEETTEAVVPETEEAVTEEETTEAPAPETEETVTEEETTEAPAPETEEPVAEETTAAQEDAAEVPEDQTETAE